MRIRIAPAPAGWRDQYRLSEQLMGRLDVCLLIRRFAGIAMLGCAVSALAAGNSATGKKYGIVPLRLGSGSAPTVTPTCPSPSLSYFGGPVVSDVQVVPVLWNSNVNAEIGANIASFFSDVTVSPYWNEVLSEYSTASQWIGPGASSAAVTIAPSKCPATTTSTCYMTDADLQNELAAQIQNHVLPAPQQDGAGNTYTAYMVYFPSNVSLSGPAGAGTSCQQFCAYHSTASFGAGKVPLPYGVVMDFYSGACSAGCGANTPFGNTTELSSHELSELVTDPEIGLDTQTGFAFPAAWGDNSCGEIADICTSVVPGDTITVDSRTWIVQQLWSNQQNACVSSGPPRNGPVLAVAAPSAAPSGIAFPFSVTANHPSPGGTFTAYAGTVHFTSTDPDAVLPADFTFVPADLGTAEFPATLNSAGLQTITATDTLNGAIVGTSASINIDGTSLSTACPTTFVENQSIAITATVGSGSTVSGTVAFQAGATVFCASVAVSSGSATCQTPALALQGGGTTYVYDVVANYSGDAANSASASAPLALTVLQASDVVARNGFEATLPGCPSY